MRLPAKKRLRQAVALLLLVAGPALGGGGDWKMGPFGPYWDDNSWPEFTPMYWMEEFMNRLDDDDAEIQAWMLRNQFPAQSSGADLQSVYPQNNRQFDAGTGSQSRPEGGPYPEPYNSSPTGNTYIFGGNNPPSRVLESETGPLPYLTPQEFARMPIELQREYKRAFEREYPLRSTTKPKQKPKQKQKPMPQPKAERRTLPNLTPQEYSRMPVELQREYRRAFEREYSNTPRRAPEPPSRPLPNLTPQEYGRMPPELQREYRRAFEHEYGTSRQPSGSNSRRLPLLTREEFARMPADLQRRYKRELERN